MDGLLIVDKPAGPTSHDVVSRMRRALREKRIGHTGTLDPMATGVLLLVVGKATRLAKFLSASDKSYDAIVRFGFATDTADAQGRPLAEVSQLATPSRAAIDAALEAFRGSFMQQPPAFSAKKIDGQRSYKLAHAARPKPLRHLPAVTDLRDLPAFPAPPALATLPAPVRVTAHRIEIVAVDADTATLRVHCSAGFYIRSLAHDLGERLGVGAHLAALRRTRIGEFGVERAVPLEAAERDPRAAAAAMVPLAGMLPGVAAVTLTAEGVERAIHGRDLGPGDMFGQLSAPAEPSADFARPFSGLLCRPLIKLLDRTGALVAIAEPTPAGGLLHPCVVLV